MPRNPRAWLERLRDGRFVDPVPLRVASLVAVAVGTAACVAFHTEPTISAIAASVIITGVVVVVPNLWFPYADRATARRVHEVGGLPIRLWLPVRRWASGQCAVGVPTSLPVVWTVDDAGLHGWAPEEPEPVSTVRLVDVTSIDVGEYRPPWYPTFTMSCIRLETVHGPVRLRARYGLGSVGGGSDRHDRELVRALRAVHPPEPRPVPRGSALGLPGD